jgi:putative membrane protein
MMNWNDYGFGWNAGFGMLMMVVIWGGLIALGVWTVARITRGQEGPPIGESPRQILDRRFASGEIDTEHYADARRILEGRGAVTPTPHG